MLLSEIKTLDEFISQGLKDKKPKSRESMNDSLDESFEYSNYEEVEKPKGGKDIENLT